MINYVKVIIKKYSGIILLSIGLLVSLPFFWIGCVDYQLQHPIHFNNTNDAGASGGAFGDFSNWFQALVAMWTLLGVFYAAVKAKQASDSASELTEKSYMSGLFVHISEKIHESFLQNINIRKKENHLLREKEKRIYEFSYSNIEILKIEQNFEEEISNLHEEFGDKLIYIGDMLTYISDIIEAIEQTSYVDKKFYKKIFLSYLTNHVREEIKCGFAFKNSIIVDKDNKDNKYRYPDSMNYNLAVNLCKKYINVQDYFNIKPMLDFEQFIEA